MSFLRLTTSAGWPKKHDWPSYTEEEPEIYEQKKLTSCREVRGQEAAVVFEFFLMTGMREQEVMHCHWSDVSFAAATARVTHKPDLGWTPKAYKERTIPIPQSSQTRSRPTKAKSDKVCKLLFPTGGCRPKLDFLDCLKAIAERAQLLKEDFRLHKSARRSQLLSVGRRRSAHREQWLGHSDMESTMRYLKPSRSQRVRDKVHEIFAYSGSDGFRPRFLALFESSGNLAGVNMIHALKICGVVAHGLGSQPEWLTIYILAIQAGSSICKV